MKAGKVVSPAEAAALIKDGDCVTTPGFVGIGVPDELALLRFDAAPLIASIEPKETDYGTETDGRISPRCCADRANEWADAQTDSG